MTELIPWLIAIIGALLGLLGFNARKTIKRAEETSRRQAENLRKTKEVKEDVETLSNDGVISEFERLHRNRRR